MNELIGKECVIKIETDRPQEFIYFNARIKYFRDNKVFFVDKFGKGHAFDMEVVKQISEKE